MATIPGTARPPSRTPCTKHNPLSLPNDLALEKIALALRLDKGPECWHHLVRKPHNRAHTPAFKELSVALRPFNLLILTIDFPTLEVTPAFLPHYRTNHSMPKRHHLASRRSHLHPSLQQHRTLARKHRHHRNQTTLVEPILLKMEQQPTCKESHTEETRISRSIHLSTQTVSPHNYPQTSNSSSISECKKYGSGNISNKCKQITLQCRTDTQELEPTLR